MTLLSLTGAGGTGKSTALVALARLEWGRPLDCIEFDSIGVPEGADTEWRHGAIEHWVRVAVDAQREGRDVLLCGQVPPGELLAAPSADLLDGLKAWRRRWRPGRARCRAVGSRRSTSGSARPSA